MNKPRLLQVLLFAVVALVFSHIAAKAQAPWQVYLPGIVDNQAVADETPTLTVTPTATGLATEVGPTATSVHTHTPTPTSTATATPTPTNTATNTPTSTATSTATATTTATPTVTPTPTSTPDTLTFFNNWSYYYNSLGDLHIVGEVQNISDQNALFTQVTAHLSDANGNVLASQTRYVWERIIFPGDTACFDVFFTDPPPNEQISTVRFEYEHLVGGQILLGVSFNNVTGNYYAAPDRFVLAGNVVNTSSLTAFDTVVSATLYSQTNGQGIVLRCQLTSPTPEDVPAQTQAPFEITFLDLQPGSVGSYAYEVQSIAP